MLVFLNVFNQPIEQFLLNFGERLHDRNDNPKRRDDRVLINRELNALHESAFSVSTGSSHMAWNTRTITIVQFYPF